MIKEQFLFCLFFLDTANYLNASSMLQNIELVQKRTNR